MSEEPRKNMSRDERLAAKLRENLRRRKAQGRAQSLAGASATSESVDPQPLPNSPSES